MFVARSFRELHTKLHAVGFKTNMGPDDAGVLQLYYTRSGGYYIGMYVEFRTFPLRVEQGHSHVL